MADIKELLKQLGDNQEANYKAYKALFELVTRASAPGSEDKRADAAKGLAAELNAVTEVKKDEKKPTYSGRARSQIARLLGYVARDEDLPALKEALNDLDVRESARLALDRINSDQAVQTLIGANEDVEPIFRVGVVNSLGKRTQSSEAFNFLKTIASGESEKQVRIAAVEALSNFADPAADESIAPATQEGMPMHRARAQKARVRLAENLKRAGKNNEAKKIFQAIMDSEADAPQKKAAELGLKSLA